MRVAAVLAGLAALTLLDISAETAQAQSFNGAYAGVHAGARWVNGTADLAPFGEAFSFSSVSPLLGGHVGFNLTPAQGFLVGLEADFDAADNSTTAQVCLTCDGVIISSVRVGPQATLRGRIGAVAGSSLFYATGGIALTEVDWTNTTFISVSQNQVRTGWVAGGGYETFVNPNLIFRTEYLYEDFGHFSVPLAFADPGDVSLTAQKVRLGLSFKF